MEGHYTSSGTGEKERIKQAGLKVQPAVKYPMFIQLCCIYCIPEETTVFYNGIDRIGIGISHPCMIRNLVKELWNYYNYGY